MRAGQTVQSLSYALRLPDAVQGAALRLLDASRAVINATVAALWERLDDFGERETKYAYKQVTALIRVHSLTHAALACTGSSALAIIPTFNFSAGQEQNRDS